MAEWVLWKIKGTGELGVMVVVIEVPLSLKSFLGRQGSEVHRDWCPWKIDKRLDKLKASGS